MPLRKVHDLDLIEVSLLDRTTSPAYVGTLVSVRAENGDERYQFRGEPLIAEAVDTVDETTDSVEATEEAVGILEDEGKATEERSLSVRDDSEAETPSEPPVEKPVEKPIKVNYNRAMGIIKNMKEEK